MAKLTEEDRLDKFQGYKTGRGQAEKGRPWRIGEKSLDRSDAYKEAHRQGYLSIIASGKFKPQEPKPKNSPSNEDLAQVHKKGYEHGFEDGYRKALIEIAKAPNKPPKALKGQGGWSDQKTAGYQWGYRQAVAGHKPNASGDLRSDPEFDSGYLMGYKAGSKVERELQTA